MTNITSQTTAALSRSWRRVARPRRWLLRLSAAGSGCALLAAGDRAPGGILLVLGLTLPVWRAPEREEHPAQRFRSRHRRIAARAGLLLVTAVIAAPHLSPLLLLLAPLPSLLEPYLWLAWPAGLRRMARVARASEAVREAWGYTSSPPAFDPDQGAAGRIEPLLAHPGGEPSKRSAKRATRPPGKVMTLRDGFRWDGVHLYYGNRSRFRVLRLAPPGPGRPGPTPAPLPGARRLRTRRPVTEIVRYSENTTGNPDYLPQWSGSSTVLLLDADGFLLRRLGYVQQPMMEMATIVQAAGLRFAAYDFGSNNDGFVPLTDRLFPTRLPRPVLRTR
ncbi:hypothetical protein [Streptacidiphilus sp. EB103A]|uniref:hypothetical protein n=1 Tax=Streptacidiphilus sp. EB103A TaxID=3156275 RepID=UPI00351575E8